MNKIDLTGRKAIITGGARGIGYAITERLLDSGAGCSLWDRDAARLEQAAKILPGPNNVHTTVVDITRADSAEEAAEATFRQFGRIDILVNNAGIAGVTKPLWELTPQEWREVIEYGASIFLALVSGNILGSLIFQVLPRILAQGGKPNVAAFKIARLLGHHVGEEQLRRRARLIQDLIHTAGPLVGVAVTAIGSIYAGLKGVLS